MRTRRVKPGKDGVIRCLDEGAWHRARYAANRGKRCHQCYAPVDGAITCAACTEKRRKRQAEAHRRLVDSGVCGRCGGPRDDGRINCSQCRTVESIKRAVREGRA